MRSVFLAYFGFLTLFNLSGCQPTPRDGSALATTQGFSAPVYFPPVRYPLAENPVTPAGFALGRRLFYDPILSQDSTLSCASCHAPTKAFSNAPLALSVGVQQRLGMRNSPSLANLAFQRHYFWDGGVNHLDFSPLNAITQENEMNENLRNIIQKLNRHPRYPGWFAEAFGSDSIHTAPLLKALAQFTLCLISDQSPYDRWRQGDQKALSAEAQAGRQLFTQKCATCHQGELFGGDGFANNGLDTQFSDEGRFRISLDSADRGKFRIPSLRNVALTPPYMHDGRLPSLEAVLEHYAQSVKDSPTLDARLTANGQPGIALSPEEKAKIIAFLNALSDESFTENPAWESPFERTK
ncbi:MAG: c-type cytochrome [Bacteroidia bacterium]|nr:c-type cytochrome [Bacteroidia bacterium]